MENKGAKELYGLIGYPVKHSYSAFMHNAAFRHLGIPAEYQLFEVAPAGLDEFFKKTIAEKHILGFNVTVPHKEKAAGYLDVRSTLVKKSGAVNTICVGAKGRLSGYNTDVLGFLRDLKERNIGVRGCKVALLGAGGGAKAVAWGLLAQGPKELRVFDIDIERTDALCKNLRTGAGASKIPVVSVVDIAELQIPQADVLVNATPVGMKESDSLFVKKEWLHPELFVYDLIYNPAETKLLKTAREAGCRTANGLGMLLYQGVLAFEHWTGKEAPVEVMRKALLERMHA